MNNSVKKYLSEIGRKGGSSKSDAKRLAVINNIAKAREIRLKKIKERKHEKGEFRNQKTN